VRKVALEIAATLGALAAVSAYMALRDPTSEVRLALADAWERLQEWSIRYRVDELVDAVSVTVVETERSER
jgi:hypothetical protein